jgi:NAD-reducing hydrogenase large subunit
MSQTIVIDPVTRIEGHAKISIFLNDAGEVDDARFHVVEYRGFEKFCEGRPFTEMAGITARICGICPVSHLLAAAKTGDKILAVKIPAAAEKLRRLMNLAQLTQSHALSFFHLSSPDFLLGWDSDPAKRNVFGLIEENPDLARAGIRLRQFGQTIIELLGARKIHAAWTVPGGVRSPLSEEGRQWIIDRLPESFATLQIALDLFKGMLESALKDEVNIFGDFPSLFMSLVGKNGEWEHYGGHLRFVDSQGNVVADNLSEDDYMSFLGEGVEKWSYLKFPYYRPWGYPEGIYRVGPLARINTCTHIDTPKANAELQAFRQQFNGTVNSSFLYHYARLIEILACLEKIEILMADPDLLSKRVRAEGGVNELEAVGVSEAPRGTLFHHYKVDENGIIEKVNLIIATGQNNLAMNQTVAQIAKQYIHNNNVQEGFLNRVEAGIRCFDPCLSCSTHAAGQMPLKVDLVNPAGEVIQTIVRD